MGSPSRVLPFDRSQAAAVASFPTPVGAAPYRHRVDFVENSFLPDNWCAAYSEYVQTTDPGRATDDKVISACRWLDWCSAHDLDPLANPAGVARRHAVNWINRPSADGVKPALATRELRLSYGRQFYRWIALEFGDYLDADPFEGISLAGAQPDPPRNWRRLSHVELDALWSACCSWSAAAGRALTRHKAVLALLIDHGARPCELYSAPVEAYRPADARTGLPATLHTRVKRGPLVARELSERAGRCIDAYLRLRGVDRRRRREPLFATDSGRPLTLSEVERLVRAVAARARLDGEPLADWEEITPYTFRRSWAVDAEAAKMPMTMLMRNLGHRDIRTTARYLQRVGAAASAADVLEYRRRRQ